MKGGIEGDDIVDLGGLHPQALRHIVGGGLRDVVPLHRGLHVQQDAHQLGGIFAMGGENAVDFVRQLLVQGVGSLGKGLHKGLLLIT